MKFLEMLRGMLDEEEAFQKKVRGGSDSRANQENWGKWGKWRKFGP